MYMGWNTRKGDQPNDGWWRAWFDHVPSPGLDQDLGPSALKNASAAASIASTAGDVVQDSLAALNWLYVKWFPLRFPSWEINNIHIYIYMAKWLDLSAIVPFNVNSVLHRTAELYDQNSSQTASGRFRDLVHSSITWSERSIRFLLGNWTSHL